MSTTSDETPPQSPTPAQAMEMASQSPQSRDLASDVFLWREKKLSLSVLGGSTAVWFVIEVLGLSFLTVASWVGIAALSPLFIWANLAPLFDKDPPELFDWELSVKSAIWNTNNVREAIEGGLRWMIRVAAQRDWLVFGQLVAGLLLLSWLGSKFDLLTILYVGVLVGLTCPPVYVKYEESIRGLIDNGREQGRKWREQGRKWRDVFDDKVWKKVKKNVVKEKKAE